MRGLSKFIVTLSLVAVVACSATNVAFAHGHHGRRARATQTTTTTVEYAACYQNGYCDGTAHHSYNDSTGHGHHH